MRIQISARSHVGKVRTKNEDNICFLGATLPEQKTDHSVMNATVRLNKPAFLGVFDGMGGYSCGEIASAMAARVASDSIRNADPRNVEQVLFDICEKSNLQICQYMSRTEGLRMGTTASMLYFWKKSYTLCNIGDSPVFRFRNSQLTEIHQEHTERATYESVTGKKAEPGKKFRLTQNIGISPDEFAIEPFCTVGDIRPGDIYLICSDGITDMVSPAQIIHILNDLPSAAEIAERLEQQALSAGGKDNATVICVRVLRGL